MSMWSGWVRRSTIRFANAKFVGLVCLLLVLATASSAQTPDPKAEAAKLQPGAYYWTGVSWSALEPLEWSANGIKNIGRSSVWMYRHPKARVQLKEAMPLFCYRLPESTPGETAQSPPPDLVIARLEEKKDRRQLEISSGTAAFAFRAGSIKRGTLEVTATVIISDVFLVSPREPLSAGEYAIGGSSLALNGFDFGIHSTR